MSDPYEKKRLQREQRRIERERELRKHMLMAGGGVIAVLVVILLVLTLRNRSDASSVHPAQDAATVGQQDVNTADGTTIDDTADGSNDGTSVSIDSSSVTALSTVESTAESAENETESTSTGWTLLPIEEQELVYTDTSVDWNLVLVNPTHRITSDFYVDAAQLSFASDYYFDYRAVDALDEMLYDCQAEGYTPIVRAGLRSWNTQQGLYDNKVEEWINDEGYSREEAEEIAATIVALPGTSEHQLGLAVDIASEGYDKLNSSQADAPTQQWLTAHCAEYGFILRFPYGKSDYTGIIWEPWHYRYVGKEAAQEIMERGICLEEYLAEKGIGN